MFPRISHLPPLWATCGSVLPLIKTFFYLSSLNLTSFSLKVLPLSNTTVPAKKFVPTFVPPIKGHSEGYPEPSFLQAEQSQFFQCFLTEDMYNYSDHFCDHLLDLFHQVLVLSVLKHPELDAIHQVDLTPEE